MSAALEPSLPPDAYDDLAVRLRRAWARALEKSEIDGRLDPAKAEETLFAHTHALGAGFRRHYGVTLDLAELARVLPRLFAPCVSAEFALAGDHRAADHRRPPCPAGGEPHRCDLTREAIDGLVLGLTDGAVRFARHGSLAHGGGAGPAAGDSSCHDLLYTHPEDPRRFGPTPDSLRPGLEAIAASFARLSGGQEVEFLGVSEGELAYRVTGSAQGESLATAAMVERAVARRFPDLHPVDVSPRAVLSTSA